MIKSLLLDNKGRFVLASMLSATGSFIGLWLISFINQVVAKNNPYDSKHSIMLFAIAVIGFFIIGYAGQYSLNRLTTSLIYQLRSMLLSNVLATSHQQREKLGSHRIYATLTSDIASLSGALSSMPLVIFNLLTVVLCIVYLAYLSLGLLLIFVAVLIVALVTSAMVMSRGTFHLDKLRQHEDAMHYRFKALLEGEKELSLSHHRREHFMHQEATPVLADVRDTHMKAELYWSFSQCWATSVLFLAIGALVFGAPLLPELSQQTLMAFVIVVMYLVSPLSFVVNSMQVLARGKVAFSKINSLSLAIAPDLIETKTEVLDKQWQTLKITELGYQYCNNNDDYQFSLKPVTLSLNRGEVVYICGGNGSGKSTFIKTLLGLYKASSGTVQLDNQLISEAHLSDYQSQFSCIFVDFYLFDSVLNAQGEVADNQEVEHYLEKLKLQHKVQAKDGQLSTTKLSQGQRKRLALLHSYIQDAPIVVFDEWAADQDPTFRAFFYHQLLPQLKAQNKLVIAVTHDDEYFHLADKLIKFNEGQGTQCNN